MAQYSETDFKNYDVLYEHGSEPETHDIDSSLTAEVTHGELLTRNASGKLVLASNLSLEALPLEDDVLNRNGASHDSRATKNAAVRVGAHTALLLEGKLIATGIANGQTELMVGTVNGKNGLIAFVAGGGARAVAKTIKKDGNAWVVEFYGQSHV